MHLSTPMIAMAGFGLALVACAPATPPAAALATPQAAPASSLKVVKDVKLGSILVDANGKTVYLCTGDERNKSNCASSTWPRLGGDRWTAGEGMSGDLLKAIDLADGNKQAAYNGWPLYSYAGDRNLGDTSGEGVSGVWFAVAPDGGPVQVNATVKAAKRDAGDVLTDASGRTLYARSAESDGKPSCAKDCAQRWPALVTVGDPKAGAGVIATLLGTVKREDGAIQVTYKRQPLYYNLAIDERPGDAKGQARNAFGSDWFMMAASGELIRAGVSAPAPASGQPSAPSGDYGY